MKTIFLVIVMAALLLPVGCKKNADVAGPDYTGDMYNQLTIDVTPQQVAQGRTATVYVKVFNGYPHGTPASLRILSTEGYLIGVNDTIFDEVVAVFHPPQNNTEYPKLVILTAETSKFIGNVYVNRSASIEVYILPAESESSNEIDFSSPFQFIDEAGKISTYTPRS